jgi:hypothetical protein
VRQRNSNKRGVEHRLRQSLPGEKSPDRNRNTGLQDASLVVGEPMLVEVQEGQPATSNESFDRYLGSTAFKPQGADQAKADLL